MQPVQLAMPLIDINVRHRQTDEREQKSIRLLPLQYQLAGHLTYASLLGHTLLDAALYLPKSWTDDPARRPRPRFPTWSSLSRSHSWPDS